MINSQTLPLAGEGSIHGFAFGARIRARVRAYRKLLRLIAVASLAGAIVVSAALIMQATALREVSAERALPARLSQQSVHIANTGLVYLQGARVEALSSTKVTLISEWSGGTFVWNVRIGPATKVVLGSSEVGTRTDIQIGDYVAVSGRLAGDSAQPSIDAESIRLRKSSATDDHVVNLSELDP